MKIGVKIMPREVLLDSQGRAVENLLKEKGHSLNQCRVGKFIELDIPTSNEKEALAEAEKIAQFVLHNPLLENFELKILEN